MYASVVSRICVDLAAFNAYEVGGRVRMDRRVDSQPLASTGCSIHAPHRGQSEGVAKLMDQKAPATREDCIRHASSSCTRAATSLPANCYRSLFFRNTSNPLQGPTILRFEGLKSGRNVRRCRGPCFLARRQSLIEKGDATFSLASYHFIVKKDSWKYQGPDRLYEVRI
jgi:hypothetical protein